jgi:hypothetical protein
MRETIGSTFALSRSTRAKGSSSKFDRHSGTGRELHPEFRVDSEPGAAMLE